jgi:hypothetical protein
MNGKVARRLRRLAKFIGTDYESLKKEWKWLSRKERDKLTITIKSIGGACETD